MPSNQIIIDQNNGVASLTLFVEGVEVTSYVYDNGMITLSERVSDVNVPLNELVVNVDDIREFSRLIEKKLNPLKDKDEFWYRLEYENSKDK